MAKNGLFAAFILVQFISLASPQAPNCCDNVSGSCAVSCRQVSLATLAAVAAGTDSYPAQLRSLSASCPLELINFWNCMNDTLIALREGAEWEGRSCCTNAQTPHCKRSCFLGLERADVERGCRRSDEPSLYHCLQRQHDLEECCGQSNRPDCVSTCHALLRQPAMAANLVSDTRRKLVNVCERESSLVSCVLNITQSATAQVTNPEKFLPCCAEGRNSACRDTCQNMFQSNRALEKVVIDTLIAKGCGQPRPDDKMWGCFLQRVEPQGTTTSPSKIHRLGMDAPKLHCCHRSRGETCRRLCYNTYSREWSDSWADFDSICLSSPDQVHLRSCVEEVDEPCELGCDGLSFCTEFNHRPAELFRRCSSAGDLSAQAQFQYWMASGLIPLSDSHRLPIRNDSGCSQRWKMVACALELKPCHLRNHATQICLSDCVSLLHDCLDFDQFLDEGQEVESICELLSPPSGKPCISLSKYSPVTDVVKSQVTRPCQSLPCNHSQMCSVSQSGCPKGGDCPPYTCVDGCRLGEVSKIVAEVGALVRVPIPTPGCHRLCRCSAQGQVNGCLPPKCDSPSPCWVQRRRIDHGTTFTVDCNLCSCRSGEIACTKQNCFPTTAVAGQEERKMTPCACAPILSPVCGSNGKTYFSHCIARCSGLSDAEIEPGDCKEKNVCEGVYCGSDHRCIPYHRVCLHPYRRKCHQYQCVPSTCSNRGIVCDTSGNQHENLCSLLAVGQRLSHNGQCTRQCDNTTPVCGIDGMTYTSECAAEGAGIPKDYEGKCRFLAINGRGVNCPNANCPSLPVHCSGVVPPGACCPLCAGLARLTFSPALTLRLAEETDSQLVTVDVMRRKLESLVQTAECRLGAYLGQGAELVVIVRPRWTPYTKVHLYACAAEAHRISVLVNRKSSILQIDAVLNLLSGAVSYELGSAGSVSKVNWILTWTCIAILPVFKIFYY